MIETLWLGEIPYREAMTMMDEWVTERRSGDAGDRLFLLTHPEVITYTRTTRSEELPDHSCGIDLVRTDRGGYATYHGPGQLIGYLVIGLGNVGPSALIRWVEDTLIAALSDIGIFAYRRDTPPGSDSLVGVWAGDDRKIASIGMRIRKGITSHGFALNVNPDLAVFDRFTACRLPDTQMGSLEQITSQASPIREATVRTAIATRFQGLPGRTPTTTSTD
ncbi:lipoyl(octanoyl) transferase LipB [Brevibacterium casei]|uniref:lipoyl(octanoyl) transferase LipB n=1 Tax=Brevibacterium casei TaxID=33889 RepID=UPI003F7FF8D2